MYNAILRVLIVEDTPERQKILINLYKDHAWILVNTARRAQNLLKVFSFDIISLDYDLAGPQKGDEVARSIKSSNSVAALVIVHSMNVQGSEKIMKELSSAVSAPFSKITRNNNVFKRLRSQLKNGVAIDWKFVFSRD